MGRHVEARAKIREASSIAAKAQNKTLLASTRLIEAWSSFHSATTARLERWPRKYRLAGTQFGRTATQARSLSCLIQAQSGASRSGKRLCEAAVKMATQTDDQYLISTAQLAQAEVELDGGGAQKSLQLALLAQENVGRMGQAGSEWRAWFIAARASRQLGNKAATREYAENANARLASLEQDGVRKFIRIFIEKGHSALAKAT